MKKGFTKLHENSLYFCDVIAGVEKSEYSTGGVCCLILEVEKSAIVIIEHSSSRMM